MNKQEFLSRLREGLSGLPQEDVAERLQFYGEMIDDKTEEGLSEDEAVAQIGPVEQIVSQSIEDPEPVKPAQAQPLSRRRLRAWEIVLLVLGSPLWLSLLVAVFAVVLSFGIAVWAVVLSLWAAALSLAVCAVCGAAAGILLLLRGDGLRGTALLGAGMVLAGFSVFLFFGCRTATKGAAFLTKKTAFGIKALFTGRRMKKNETGN